MNNIYTNILISKNIESKNEGKKYLKIFFENFSDLIPEYYNVIEPINKPVIVNNLDQMLNLWNGSPFYLKRRNPKILATANSGKKDYIYGSIDIVCKSKTIDKEIASLKNFIIKSSKEFNAEFGYLHPIYNEKEFESFVAADINLYSNFKNPSLYISSFKIKKCIPNLFWLTLFGPTYVNFFGKAKIENIPCYKISKLSNKLYAIQLTKDILDLKNNFQDFDEIRNKAKEHLGLNAFFNPVLKTDFKYETPKFPSGFAEHKKSIESIDFQILQKSLKTKKKISNFDT